MPEISVIIPVYRAESYLAACLDSVLGQSFRDLEVIAVDDGSPDSCWEILTAYAARDSRVRPFRQENAGQATARNFGLRQARGQWLCFVDSDDAIHPRMLELLHRGATESGCSICQCRMLENPEFPQGFDGPRRGEYTVLPMDEGTLAELLDRGEYPGWVSCAKLLRRELVEGYPFQESRVYEDNEAVCRWIVAAGRIADIREELYFYRTNPDSTTKGRFSEKSLDYLWALESILLFYQGLGWGSVVQRFLERYGEAAVSCCYGLKVTLERPQAARQTAKNTRRFLHRSGLRLPPEREAELLELTHPRLARLYWPVHGAAATLRQEGLGGLGRKLRKFLGGGKP